MSDRINTPLTNEHFVAYCLRMVGQPYWYGTCGYKATKSLLTRKSNQYPSHYTSGRKSRYKQDIENRAVVADCIGGCKGYAWTGGGAAMLDAIGTDGSVKNSYGSNGCPDKGAGGMFSYAKSKGKAWGDISTLPEVPGLAVHKDGHVGYYVGNGEVVEWRGFAYGCVKTKLLDRAWLYWYELPFIDYGDSIQSADTAPLKAVLGSRLLKKNMTGTDVQELQETLLQLGYTLPKHGADGKYGSETEKAVKAFQKAEGLTQDGKYGDRTHAALMEALADKEDGTEPPEAEAEPPTPRVSRVVLVSRNGRVNIRTGNGTNYARITSASDGASFVHVATAGNGWHAVVVGSRVGWVSGEFSKVESV